MLVCNGTRYCRRAVEQAERRHTCAFDEDVVIYRDVTAAQMDTAETAVTERDAGDRRRSHYFCRPASVGSGQ